MSTLLFLNFYFSSSCPSSKRGLNHSWLSVLNLGLLVQQTPSHEIDQSSPFGFGRRALTSGNIERYSGTRDRLYDWSTRLRPLVTIGSSLDITAGDLVILGMLTCMYSCVCVWLCSCVSVVVCCMQMCIVMSVCFWPVMFVVVRGCLQLYVTVLLTNRTGNCLQCHRV